MAVWCLEYIFEGSVLGYSQLRHPLCYWCPAFEYQFKSLLSCFCSSSLVSPLEGSGAWSAARVKSQMAFWSPGWVFCVCVYIWFLVFFVFVLFC